MRFDHTAGWTCEQCQDGLIAYMAEQLPPDAHAAIAAHLAQCPQCRAEESSWRVLAAVAQAEAREVPLDREAEVQWAALRARLPVKTVVTASPRESGEKAEEESMRRERRPNRSVPAPISPERRPAARTRLFASLAFVLVVALSLALFGVAGTRLRSGMRALGSSHASTVAPTACAPSALRAHLPAHSSVTSISMRSPQSGWAAGFVWDPQGSTPPATLLLRFANCQWSQVGEAIPDAELTGISMGSASDGWAVGTTMQDDTLPGVEVNGQPRNDYLPHKLLVLHYSGGSWQQVDILGNPPASAQVKMLSATAGWMLLDMGKRHTDPYTAAYSYALLRYINGAWTPVDLSFKPATTIISAFAAVSPDACWLAGYDTGASGGGFLAHYANGRWSTSNGTLAGVRFPSLYALDALSPADIWAAGSTYYHDAQGDHDGSLLLHYDGSQWTRVPTPNVADVSDGALMSITMLSPVEGWAFYSSVATLRPHGGLALRYNNGQWHEVQLGLNAISSVSSLVMDSPTAGWAIGTTLVPTDSGSVSMGQLLRYEDGTWHGIWTSASGA